MLCAKWWRLSGDEGGRPISELVTTTLLHTLAFPFLAGGVVALAGWACGFSTRGLAVGPGVLAGFLLGQGLIAGWPQLPPVGSVDRLVWLGLLAGGVALLLPWLGGGWGRRLGIGVLLAVAVVWIGWTRLSIGQEDAWVAAVTLVLAGYWASGRLERQSGSSAALLLAVAAFAAAVIAVYSASYSMAQLIAALGAALAGGMAGAGAAGAGLGSAGRMMGGVVLLGLVAMMAFYTRVEPLALLLLLPIFLADSLLRHFPGAGNIAARAEGRGQSTVSLGLLALMALIPAGLAVAVAVSRAGPLYY